MACRDCGQSARPLPVGQCRTFTAPLDGAEVDITVRGVITEANLTLVKQYLTFVYDVLTTVVAPVPPEGDTHG